MRGFDHVGMQDARHEFYVIDGSSGRRKMKLVENLWTPINLMNLMDTPILFPPGGMGEKKGG